MEASLEELQKDQQICLKLFYLEKKSYQEIAEERGYTLLQVKSYIQNGKRNLKILIEKKLNSNHYWYHMLLYFYNEGFDQHIIWKQ